ncbi:MAG TPA: hypothetical protein VFR43_13075 [Gaiellaceae bacterium]|nr:hypothetical protein [Gaiellaceae bacterium]
MSQALDRIERHRGRRISASSLGLLALVALGPVTAVLALFAVPNAFDIEWNCVATSGATPGDTYAGAAAVVGVFGWLLVFVGVLFAHIGERTRLAAVLPVAWSVLYMGGCVLGAAAAGPAPCPV